MAGAHATDTTGRWSLHIGPGACAAVGRCPVSDTQKPLSQTTPESTPEIAPRKVFVPYISGHVYDLWGGEPHNIRIFASREKAKVFGFTDVREVELWEY